ncbi:MULTISPECIES: hypothetical protein [Microbacterium]|uniref:hypothetical protein n=1 Tax=Microbacterium TaxID=33882 RepID=UPI0006F56D1C|nr:MULTISPECIES: hypothetical protein [Microbacterium]KQR21496.1 hypothetical protein ASF76_14765 [Microbacterium sp. Leaf151]MCI9857550.1 hypothetical protein [Microbacterium proteolyticum]
MNDPDGHDDDPDGVTLWSGRLRAWPAAPEPDGNEDDTLSARRTTSGGGAPPSRAAENDERPPSHGDTASRAARRGDAPLPPPALADQRPPSALDDVTAPSVLDSDTAPSRSRTPHAGAGLSPPGDTSTIPAAIDGSLPASVADTSTVPRAGVEPRLSASIADTEEDSGPRGIRPVVPVVDGEPPAQREARSPVALRRESYAPRVDEPARVARASTGGAVRSSDAALVHPRRSPGRVRLVVLAAAVVAVVALAAVGVALLLG